MRPLIFKIKWNRAELLVVSDVGAPEVGREGFFQDLGNSLYSKKANVQCEITNAGESWFNKALRFSEAYLMIENILSCYLAARDRFPIIK